MCQVRVKKGRTQLVLRLLPRDPPAHEEQYRGETIVPGKRCEQQCERSRVKFRIDQRQVSAIQWLIARYKLFAVALAHYMAIETLKHLQ